MSGFETEKTKEWRIIIPTMCGVFTTLSHTLNIACNQGLIVAF